MADIVPLILAVAAFVVGHELLSHPLRAPLMARLGAGGFAGVYSVVAFATLGLSVQLWRGITPERLWSVPAPLHWLMVALMLAAAILFVGSVTAPNPALTGMAVTGAPRGAQRITRHPMMWSFALWGIVHIVLSADPRTIVLAGGIVTLALVGAAMQDGKKAVALPGYRDHIAATGFVPFAAQVQGRLPWSSAGPGAVAGLGGAALFALLLGLHPWLIGASPLPQG